MPTKTNSSSDVQKEWIDTTKIPDPKLGTEPITGDRYYSKEFMEQEWEKMWTKVWLIAKPIMIGRAVSRLGEQNKPYYE